MMSVRKKKMYVEQILGEVLFPIGFTFEGTEKKEYWTFERKAGDVLQVIELVTAQSYGALKLRYYTTTGSECCLLDHLLKEHGINPNEFGYEAGALGWHYTDDQSYIGILQIFQNLIQQYVLDDLQRLSCFHNEVRITSKNFYNLKENADVLIEQFVMQWNLEQYSFDEKIRLLSEKILELRGKSFQESEDKLSQIGLVYGDCLIKQFGGNWFWRDDWYTIGVEQVANRLITVHVIKTTFSEWQGEGTIFQEIEQIKQKIGTTEEKPVPKIRKAPKVIRHFKERFFDRL